MPVITPLPTPPSSTDPANFATRADAYLVAQNAMVTELNNAFNQIALNIIPGGATPGVYSNTGTALFEVVGSGYNAFSTTRAHGTSVFPTIELERSRGTSASPTAVQSGDTLGTLAFLGRDSSSYVSGASVRVVVAGTVTSGCVPTKMVFATTPAGGTPTDRMEIGPAGIVIVNGSTASGQFNVRAASGVSAIVLDNPSGTETLSFSSRTVAGFSSGYAANATLSLGTTTANTLQFVTDNAVRLTISPTGQFTAPTMYSITITGSANMIVDASGNIGRATSGRKYKTNIVDYVPVGSIDDVRPVYYNGKDAPDGPRMAGFIAEEMAEASFDEFVFRDAEGAPDAIHYGNITALLVYEIKALRARVAALEAA